MKEAKNNKELIVIDDKGRELVCFPADSRDHIICSKRVGFYCKVYSVNFSHGISHVYFEDASFKGNSFFYYEGCWWGCLATLGGWTFTVEPPRKVEIFRRLRELHQEAVLLEQELDSF